MISSWMDYHTDQDWVLLKHQLGTTVVWDEVSNIDLMRLQPNYYGVR